jgi:DNA-binding MarR family transcriptional regulator
MAVKKKTQQGGRIAYRPAAYPTTLIRTIHAKSYANLSSSLSQYDLVPVEWRILSTLQEEDGHNIAYLAERTATERSNLTRAVDGLEEQGLVSRRRELRDRRHVQLYLTAAGRRKFEQVLPTVLWNIDRVVSGFTAAELETLMELLGRMKDNVHRGDDTSNVA